MRRVSAKELVQNAASRLLVQWCRLIFYAHALGAVRAGYLGRKLSRKAIYGLNFQ